MYLKDYKTYCDNYFNKLRISDLLKGVIMEITMWSFFVDCIRIVPNLLIIVTELPV